MGLIWSDFFECKNGMLIWKNRPESSFSSIKEFKRFHSTRAGVIAGTVRRDSSSSLYYRVVNLNGISYQQHRIIWEMNNGPIPLGMIIDHIDGDGLNNELSNLRLVTTSVNGMNRRISTNNRSGVMGVVWRPRDNRWQAQIWVGNKSIYLGYFVNKDDAIKARKDAEAIYGFHANHGRLA